MTIGFLKRLLKLLNLAALLIIAGAAWGYWDYSETKKRAWNPPDFTPPVVRDPNRTPRIDNVATFLGYFPKTEEKTEEVKVEEKVEKIESVLAQLGVIKSAVVAYEPYDAIYPAIIFEFHQLQPGQKSKIRTIRVGEALVDAPHPRKGPLHRVPKNYKFVKCQPDPEHPGWTYFLFDMNCDGKDIQKARWRLEEEKKEGLKAAKGGDEEGVKEVVNEKFSLTSGDDKDEPEPTAAKKGETRTETVKAPEPPPPPSNPTELPGTLFEDESGTQAPTREGVEYLKNNYKKLLQDAETRTWIDPKTKRPGGVKVMGIRKGSMVNEFGIRKSDIIISINDKPVSSQSKAINVVKAELKKRVRVIKVKINRNGRIIEKRFDTRDPDTRRKARRAFR